MDHYYLLCKFGFTRHKLQVINVHFELGSFFMDVYENCLPSRMKRLLYERIRTCYYL